MVSLQIQITGDKELLKKYGKAKNKLKDFSDEMDEIGKYFLKFFNRDVFETEGDIFGEQWARLNSKYELWKRIKYGGRKVLERSGDLRKGFKMKSGRDFARIFNPVDYAIYHQEGTSRLPKRPLVKIDNDRKKVIEDIIRRGVAKKLASSFR